MPATTSPTMNARISASAIFSAALVGVPRVDVGVVVVRAPCGQFTDGSAGIRATQRVAAALAGQHLATTGPLRLGRRTRPRAWPARGSSRRARSRRRAGPGPSRRARRTRGRCAARPSDSSGDGPVPSTPTSSNASSAASVGSSNSPSTITAEGWTGPPMNSCSCGLDQLLELRDGFADAGLGRAVEHQARARPRRCARRRARPCARSSDPAATARRSGACPRTESISLPSSAVGALPTLCYSTPTPLSSRRWASTRARSPRRTRPRRSRSRPARSAITSNRSMPTQTSAGLPLPQPRVIQLVISPHLDQRPGGRSHDRLHLFASFLGLTDPAIAPKSPS